LQLMRDRPQWRERTDRLKGLRQSRRLSPDPIDAPKLPCVQSAMG
jgi:hypothetical protein